MAQYNIPYNNWEDGDVAYAEQVLANFNAILSAINNGLGADNLAANSVTDVKIGTRTINDATAANDTAQLTEHLSGLANRIKAITGEDNWKTAPVKSLKTMNTDVVTAVSDSAAAVTTANTANTKADTAISTANTADGKADTALANSTSAVSTANTSDGKSTTALVNSATAVTTANAAEAKADTAITDSSTAVSTASTANTKANTAINIANTKANAAINIANTADTKADTAISTANSADGKADTAVSTANTALGQDTVEPYTGALGAMKIATDVQTDYETQKPLILQAVEDAEDAANSVADKVSTEQMNSAIIEAKNEIINQIDRKEPVATYADLATTYPTPEDGWLVFIRDSRNTYVYNGVTEEWEVKALEVGYADESGTDGIITSEKFVAINDFMESKGVANGLATLDATGNVPVGQLGNTPSAPGAKTARFVIGTSTAGWTKEDVDYLCDGTDDQTEINAAITALPATGGEIVILDGTYNITASINIPKDNVSIRGNGNATTLKRMYNSANAVSGPTARGLITLNGKSGCKIQGLQIDGNKATYTANHNNGIYLSTSSNDNTVTGNTCNNNNNNGIYLVSSSNNTVTGNTCNNNNNNGIYLSTSSNDNTVTGNTCNNNNNNGIYLVSSSNNTVTGNTCNNNNNGIYLSTSSNNTVTGNTCNNNNNGIYLVSSSNNTVTGNTCNNNNNYGIFLSTSSNDNTVTGNTCNNNNNGIYLVSSSNNTVTGNTCNNNNYGIFLYSSSNNTVTGNTCNGNDCGVDFSLSSSNNTVVGNTCIRDDYTSNQHTIRIGSTSCRGNLVVGNNCKGKAPTDSGVDSLIANNKS